MVEPNLDVNKSADWIIDLCPEGRECGSFMYRKISREGMRRINPNSWQYGTSDI